MRRPMATRSPSTTVRNRTGSEDHASKRGRYVGIRSSHQRRSVVRHLFSVHFVESMRFIGSQCTAPLIQGVLGPCWSVLSRFRKYLGFCGERGSWNLESSEPWIPGPRVRGTLGSSVWANVSVLLVSTRGTSYDDAIVGSAQRHGDRSCLE